MMNFVLNKLKSLFDNFNHISNWPNSLKKHAKGFAIFKTSNPGAWFTVHIRKSQISDCCFWIYLPLE